MKKIVLLCATLAVAVESLGQFKNSDEKIIYSIDNAKVSAFKFSGGETALEYNFYNKEQPFVLSGQNEVTAIKKNAFIAKVGLTNTKKFVDVDAFKLSEQGMVFGVSYLHSFDEVIQPSTGKEFNLWTYRFGGEFKYDNFNNYDPAINKTDWKRPTTFSLNASATRYWFHFKKGFTIAASLNASYLPKTYNTTSLINFKQLDAGRVNNDIAAFKDFDGKYGTIDNQVSGGNVSLSLPVFIQYQASRLIPYMVPVPYISTQYLSSAEPKYHTGLAIGFFPKSVFGALKSTPIMAKTKMDRSQIVPDNTTISRNSRTFNSPSFLTIGFDKSFQGNATSDLNIFITGSITFE